MMKCAPKQTPNTGTPYAVARAALLAAAALLPLTGCLPGLGMPPVAVSAGKTFPSDDVETGTNFGLHLLRASPAAGGFFGPNSGIDMKLHMIDVGPQADFTMNANLMVAPFSPFYLYGGGGFVMSGTDGDQVSAMGEVGLGIEIPFLVNEYRKGFYLLGEGGYMSYFRDEADAIAGPHVRVGLSFVP